jgi:polygalacturonase
MGILVLGVAGVAAAGDISPALPVIPSRSFNLTDFGGVGDGKTLNTEAINKAMAAITAAGGGQLVIPKGVFLTLPFKLVSQMDLHLDAGATLKFPESFAAYDLPDPGHASPEQLTAVASKYPALIGGEGISDVAITGGGTIDGSGAIWWNRGPNGERLGMPPYPRPKMILITHGNRIHLQGVTLINSPMYHVMPVQCQDVLIEEVHILAPAFSPNTDAIDPNASDRVLIRKCELDEGDDNVAIKAIGGPAQNVLVEDCQCKHGHGISIGSETYGGIQHVTVRRCTFDGTVNGIRIKSARDRGNILGDFSFSHITMKDVGTAIDINLYYHDKEGSRNPTTRPVTRTTPTLSGVHIDHVTVTDAKIAGDIVGLPESVVSDVSLSDVQIGCTTGFTVRDARGVVFKNVVISPQHGEALACDHADVAWSK